MELIFAFTYGFCIYPFLETVWRGYTHVTMCFAGGICSCLMFYIVKYHNGSIFFKSLLCAVAITAVELIFGMMFNVILKMDVWDYSDKPFNFMGQICLSYFFIWYFLSLFLNYLYKIFNRLTG